MGEVKGGVRYLDRSMKDVVGENPHALNLDEFIPFLSQRIKVLHPFIRNLVLTWITVLHSIESMEMLGHLPQFLEGLLSILGDTSRDIQANADAVLRSFQT